MISSPSSPFIKAAFSQFGQISSPTQPKSSWQFHHLCSVQLCNQGCLLCADRAGRRWKTETLTQTQKLGCSRKADRRAVREALVSYLTFEKLWWNDCRCTSRTHLGMLLISQLVSDVRKQANNSSISQTSIQNCSDSYKMLRQLCYEKVWKYKISLEKEIWGKAGGASQNETLHGPWQHWTF